MALQDPEEIGDVTAVVVNHLCLWAHFAAQEDAAHANERFGIGLMIDGV